MSATPKPALYADSTEHWRLLEADALLALAKLPDACLDAIVTDPPYGIDFGGEAWDGAAIRRTAGGSGVSANEAFELWTRVWASEARRVLKPGGHLLTFGAPRTFHRLVCGVENAGLEVRDQLLWLHAQGMPKSWLLPDGRSTTLKPAFEPILLARAPMQGTTAHNLTQWGTGAMNIDATRIGERWPAHVALSHASDCTAELCAEDCPAGLLDAARPDLLPSRLFFCAKASKAEREAGCEQLPTRTRHLYNGGDHPPIPRHNPHPTVKPLELMRWLVRLITPPDGVVLDPFSGSGSTGAAALLEGRRFLGIEREPEYVDIACARLTHWAHQARDGS